MQSYQSWNGMLFAAAMLSLICSDIMMFLLLFLGEFQAMPRQLLSNQGQSSCNDGSARGSPQSPCGPRRLGPVWRRRWLFPRCKEVHTSRRSQRQSAPASRLHPLSERAQKGFGAFLRCRSQASPCRPRICWKPDGRRCPANSQ